MLTFIRLLKLLESVAATSIGKIYLENFQQNLLELKLNII